MDKQKIEEFTSTLCNSIVSDLDQMKDTHKQPYTLALVCNDDMEHFFLALANTEDLEKILSENEVTLLILTIFYILNGRLMNGCV